MAHHVLSGKADMADALHIAQQAGGVHQSRALAFGQVDLRRVAGDHHARAFAKAGEKHFHLRRRAILRLVENDEGVRQGASAHKGQRGDFYSAALQPVFDLFRRQHVIKRIVKRAQIGVDLVAHVAWQKAQPLARLHGGARQDQPFDKPALQRCGGEGHGQIGLAGACRADGKCQFAAFNGFQIKALDFGASGNQPLFGSDGGRAVAAMANQRRAVDIGLFASQRIARALMGQRIKMADGAVNIARGDRLAVAQAIVKPEQNGFGGFNRLSRALQGDQIAVGVRLYIKTVFDQRKILVKLAKQLAGEIVAFECNGQPVRRSVACCMRLRQTILLKQ